MSQRAIVIEAVGQPFVLTTRPIPEPKEGEILLKVVVDGLNPHDSLGREKGYFIQDVLPAPLGIDLVGDVVKVGPQVTNFAVGDHVVTLGGASNPDQTGSQQYAIARAHWSAKVPQGIYNDDEIATLALNPFTAFAALFGPHGFNWPAPYLTGTEGEQAKQQFDAANQSLLVIGASSACGKFALEWARIIGVGKVLAVASKSPKSEAELKALGATHVFDRHLSDDELKAQVRTVTGDDLIYALDCVNWDSRQNVGANILSDSKKGTLVVLIKFGSVDEAIVQQKKGGFERKAPLAFPENLPDAATKYWEAFPGWVEQRLLTPTPYSVIEGLDVDKLNEVFDQYRDTKTWLKPHLHIA